MDSDSWRNCPDCAYRAVVDGAAGQVGGLAVWEWGAGFWALDGQAARRLTPDAERVLLLELGRLTRARMAVPR